MTYSVLTAAAGGRLFSWIKNNFRGSAGAVFTLFGQTGSVPALWAGDTVSPVLEEVCQSHCRRSSRLHNLCFSNLPLRPYFSNVQSSLWLLCSSLPSSSHGHSTLKVACQKHSAISPTKSFQKLQVCSPHLSCGLGN